MLPLAVVRGLSLEDQFLSLGLVFFGLGLGATGLVHITGYLQGCGLGLDVAASRLTNVSSQSREADISASTIYVS